MSEELKPCPFCGYTKPTVKEKRSGNGWYGDGTPGYIFYASVRCGRCFARGPLITTGKAIRSSDINGINDERKKITSDAVEFWNQRT